MIYAVNKRTKEHRVFDGTVGFPGTGWATVHSDADGWIEWHGGECPLPSGQWVEVRYRIGACRKGFAGNWSSGWWSAPGDITGPDDIIAYRPILDADTKPEPCRFHDDDTEACETYSGQVPCEPELPAWDGVGLPPVGTRCEYWTDASWDECEIIALKSGKVVFWHPRHEQAYQGPVDEYEFRLIRSEEDRAVEAMLEVIHGNGHLSETGARALYRAGYRKQEATS